MKILTLVLAIVSGSRALSYAQGEIIFANNTATRITNALTGEAWWGSDSNLLRVAAYAAAGPNQPEASLTLQANSLTNLFRPGLFFSGTRVMPNDNEGRATVQVRAWGASTLYPTYETAVAAALGGDGSVVVGVSLPISLTVGFAPGPPTPIIFYLQPFLVQPVPEPAGWALGVIGALVLLPLLRRRRP